MPILFPLRSETVLIPRSLRPKRYCSLNLPTTAGEGEEKEAEAEPEGDGETAPEDTDAENQADSDEPEEPGERGVRKLQKRVNKLTAELRATQEALRKANEAAAAPAGPEPAGPPG